MHDQYWYYAFTLKFAENNEYFQFLKTQRIWRVYFQSQNAFVCGLFVKSIKNYEIVFETESKRTLANHVLERFTILFTSLKKILKENFPKHIVIPSDTELYEETKLPEKFRIPDLSGKKFLAPATVYRAHILSTYLGVALNYVERDRKLQKYLLQDNIIRKHPFIDALVTVRISDVKIPSIFLKKVLKKLGNPTGKLSSSLHDVKEFILDFSKKNILDVIKQRRN